jgi:exosortase A-associated hydrolase 2
MLFAQFVDGPAGRLLFVGHRPEPGATQRPRASGRAGKGPHAHWVLVAPPLAEELNKSRRTLSLLGRALAKIGVGLLMVDLFGTGDSEGELRAATWQGWVEDLACAHRWLLAQGAGQVDLLAVRGGALLAWDYLARVAVDHLSLWQPVVSGRRLGAQLLRLRLAANLMGRGEGETSAGLRERLRQEQWLEIAGYGFPAQLFAALEEAELGPLDGRRLGGLDWYQVEPDAQTNPDREEAPALPLPARHTIGAWQDAGLAVEAVWVRGDAFWTTQEICEGTALIEATVRRIAERRGRTLAGP